MSLFHLIMTSNPGQIYISWDLVVGFRLISMKKIVMILGILGGMISTLWGSFTPHILEKCCVVKFS